MTRSVLALNQPTSNQPDQFDWAVNDRFDELVHFEKPGEEERRRMLLDYFQRYVMASALASRGPFKAASRLKVADDVDWADKCRQVAAATEGLSGREVAKLVTSWQAAAYASETGLLDEAIVDEKVAEAMRAHATKAAWLAEERKKIKRTKAELDAAVHAIDARADKDATPKPAAS